MTEDEFKNYLRDMYQQYGGSNINDVDGREAWVTAQYDRAFGVMNGAWNPAIAQDFLANLPPAAETSHISS